VSLFLADSRSPIAESQWNRNTLQGQMNMIRIGIAGIGFMGMNRRTEAPHLRITLVFSALSAMLARFFALEYTTCAKNGAKNSNDLENRSKRFPQGPKHGRAQTEAELDAERRAVHDHG
jgi:hypothetical protein